MPVQTTVDTELNLAVHTVTVSLSLEEIKAALDALWENPDFRPTMNTLWDVRDANVAEWSAEGIQAVARYVEKHAEQRGIGYRSAIVVAQDVAFGLSRMYEAYGYDLPLNLRVFRDIDEARRWVCVAPISGGTSK